MGTLFPPRAIKYGHDSTNTPHVFLPDMPSLGACFVCNSNDVKGYCEGCKITWTEGNNEHLLCGTPYCQHHQSQEHIECRQLKEIGRAVFIFREILIYLLGQTYSEDILNISVRNHQVLRTKAVPYVRAYKGDHVARPFPWYLASKETGLSVMMDGQCSEILTTFSPLFELLIRPACKTIRQVKFLPKNIHLGNTIVDAVTELPDGPSNAMHWHMVQVLVLESGRELVLDLTCPQFGWKDWLVPWEDYYANRVHKLMEITSSTPEAVRKQLRIREIASNFDRGYDNEADRLRTEVAEHCAVRLREWLESLYGGPEKLLGLDADDFPDERDSVLSQAVLYIDDKVAELENGKLFKLYFDFTPGRRKIHATRSHRVYNRLTDVWLTQEEYRRYGHDQDALDDVWYQKLLPTGLLTDLSRMETDEVVPEASSSKEEGSDESGASVDG
ncbi:putative MYND-type zinc finger protein samB [Seiridium cardinale]